jgi:RNA processing factor Prp31
MHGPYTEENIPRIMESRDEAANSFRGRGVKLLARLDAMFYEGSISEDQNCLRMDLFSALLNIDQKKIETIISQLSDVVNMKDEGNEPLIGRAKRLYEVKRPLLKKYFESESEWQQFVSLLKSLVAAKDVDSLSEEYDSDPWLNARKGYRKWQWDTNKCICRQTSFEVQCKSFH